jgi:hypothetical protein
MGDHVYNSFLYLHVFIINKQCRNSLLEHVKEVFLPLYLLTVSTWSIFIDRINMAESATLGRARVVHGARAGRSV